MAPSQTKMLSDVVGTGEPLILLGGGLTGWASWEPLLPRLPQDRTLIRLQPISVQCGLEDQPLPAGYSVKTESRGIGSALDSLGITGPVDLVAWSFGALAALDFALDNPDRIRSLVLIEPPAVWTLPDQGRGHPEARQLEQALPDARAEITEQMLEQFLQLAGLVPPGADPRALPQWRQWLGFRRSLRNTPAVFAHRDELARLRGFPHPVLLLTGTGTAPFLRQIIDTLARRLPQSQLVELPAGHAPHLVSLERFLPLLRGFLDSARRSAEAAEVPGR